MGSEFTFYDYLDDDGQNVIREWLYDEREVSKRARAKYQKSLLVFEGYPPPWPVRPFYVPLDRQCDGLFELRVPLDGVQYRILGFHDRRMPTLVHYFKKRGNQVPPIECQRALEKKARALADPGNRRAEHYFGK